MNKLIILSFGAICLLGASCKKDKAEEPQCLEEFSFSNDVEPIIMNSCAVSGCHSGASPANNMDFTNYDNIYLHRDLIRKSVRHESGVTPMPIGPELSADQVVAISCWVSQGAPNN
jgi:hypothetical protein